MGDLEREAAELQAGRVARSDQSAENARSVAASIKAFHDELACSDMPLGLVDDLTLDFARSLFGFECCAFDDDDEEGGV